VIFQSDIAKNGIDPLPTEGMGGGNEGEGRNDNFALEIETALKEFKSAGGIGYTDTVLNLKQCAYAILEFE